MPADPWYIRLLDKLGVNTTKLRWRLYQREQQAKRIVENGGLPARFKWLRYEHKICPHCRAVVDRHARVCSSCGKRAPGMLEYRIRRFASTLTPQGVPATINTFLAVIVVWYGVQLFLDGVSVEIIWRQPSTDSLYLGALVRAFIDQEQEYWRFLSFGLLHNGLIHIGFNCYALSVIGPIVETQLERRRMLVLITLTQVASGIASYVWHGYTGALAITVGASGWIFGLLGYGIAMFHQQGAAGKAFRDQLIGWVVFVFILGLFLPFDNAAHLGGLLCGFLFALLPDTERRRDSVGPALWTAAFYVCVALWVVTNVFMIRVLVTNWAAFTT